MKKTAVYYQGGIEIFAEPLLIEVPLRCRHITMMAAKFMLASLHTRPITRNGITALFLVSQRRQISDHDFTHLRNMCNHIKTAGQIEYSILLEVSFGWDLCHHTYQTAYPIPHIIISVRKVFVHLIILLLHHFDLSENQCELMFRFFSPPPPPPPPPLFYASPIPIHVIQQWQLIHSMQIMAIHAGPYHSTRRSQ